MPQRYAAGCDFGTESVRVVLVEIGTGRVAASSASAYRHGVLDRALPTGEPLPSDYALQHPGDWLDALGNACRGALGDAAIDAGDVAGLGVAFTSCTMLPATADGTPLCLQELFGRVPLAWPKLWKHHAAGPQTDRINAVACERGEPWLERYGGVIGLEWFFPKVLETLEKAPAVYEAAEVWLEAGDWLVWQLVSGPFPACSPGGLSRSACQAGYKAMWSAGDGFPSPDYFAAVHPGRKDVVASKMPGWLAAPGTTAGTLTKAAARLLGLRAGTPVSVATIDAHAGVPGAGVADPGTLVMVLGTSSCHMINGREERLVRGVAGVVEGGIVPGLFGYETGQASVGDAFAWLARTLGRSHAEMNEAAAKLPPGSGGIMALDWLNGCRTPLMDGEVSGGFVGLTLGTRPEQLYRALIEATAFGVRWIADVLRDGGVPVESFVASGGLPAKSPLLMQVYADVLGAPIRVAATDQPVAVGAAILGAVAADAVTEPGEVASIVRRMAGQRDDLAYRPDPTAQSSYSRLYSLYRDLANPSAPLIGAMHRLRGVARASS